MTQPFGAHYYGVTSSPPFSRHRHSSSEEQTIESLLGAHDKDLKFKVERAYKKWNHVIRDHLRAETALRLSVGDDQQAVPVRVLEGLPAPFQALAADYREPLFWKLQLYRGSFHESLVALDFLSKLDGSALAQLLDIHREATTEDLVRSHHFIHAIDTALSADPFIKKLKAIDQDILGAYFFRVPEIHLYWMVIGLIAGMLGISVEGLTVVVLTHELAHAYTHLGRDIDGGRWETEDFAGGDKHIVEGLAQFYTWLILERKMEGRFPEAVAAYQKLLTIQSGPYIIHKQWIDGKSAVAEVVRFAMIDTRMRRMTKYEAFCDALAHVRDRIADT